MSDVAAWAGVIGAAIGGGVGIIGTVVAQRSVTRRWNADQEYRARSAAAERLRPTFAELAHVGSILSMTTLARSAGHQFEKEAEMIDKAVRRLGAIGGVLLTDPMAEKAAEPFSKLTRTVGEFQSAEKKSDGNMDSELSGLAHELVRDTESLWSVLRETLRELDCPPAIEVRPWSLRLLRRRVIEPKV